jgi:hypothetical protein
MVEINGKPVLVDQKTISDAAASLRDSLINIQKLSAEVLKNGFALQTPEGMVPVNLGSANDFSDWVAAKMNSTFKLADSIAGLPEPFKSGLAVLTETDLVIYSAALFYTGDTGDAATKNKLFGELVIGFQIPDTFMQDFPLALREIVIEVNNYAPPANPQQGAAGGK